MRLDYKEGKMIKGKCPKCKSTLMIDPDSLLNMKRPIFECPSCDTKILIRPKIAKCGKCNAKFGFYPQTLTENGLCNCPKCKTLNRVK